MPLVRVSELVNVSQDTLRARAASHERLSSALSVAAEGRSPGGKTKLTQEVADRLTELTLESVPKARIGMELGVSGGTVAAWQEKLGLL